MTGREAWRASLLLGVTLLLGACTGNNNPFATGNGSEAELNANPVNYKSDILAAMHSYLNDPTGIRDAAVSPPVIKQVGNETRYVACLQFNAKKNASEYAGAKTVAAVFMLGRFDRFIDTPKDLCNGVAYTPFPELQKLPP